MVVSVGLMTVTTKIFITDVTTTLVVTAVMKKLVLTAVTTKLVVTALQRSWLYRHTFKNLAYSKARLTRDLSVNKLQQLIRKTFKPSL